MPEFKKYMHLERFGTNEVDGIEMGTTYVFPKLDGTNAQVWLDDTDICTGSRNRILSVESDNAGFHNWAIEQSNLRQYLTKNPSHTLYGEWLVPHSLRTYRDDAWRNFYVFDVYCNDLERFITYDDYKDGLYRHGIEYLAPIAIVRNGTHEKYNSLLDKNTYLIKDGHGTGEGVVIKNYEFQNKYGRVCWAKIVTTHFKEKYIKERGAHVHHSEAIEEKIANEFITQHLVDKTVAKITNDNDGWSRKFIGQLLGRVWHDFVTEEIWEVTKKHKNPKIDFGFLNKICIQKVKELRSDLF